MSVLAACVPDGARGIAVQSLTHDHLRGALVIDCHFVVVPKGEAETLRRDVAETGHNAGDVALRRPGFSTVTRAAVVGIPHGRVARIHPGDADVAGGSHSDRGEGVRNSLAGR